MFLTRTKRNWSDSTASRVEAPLISSYDPINAGILRWRDFMQNSFLSAKEECCLRTFGAALASQPLSSPRFPGYGTSCRKMTEPGSTDDAVKHSNLARNFTCAQISHQLISTAHIHSPQFIGSAKIRTRSRSSLGLSVESINGQHDLLFWALRSLTRLVIVSMPRFACMPNYLNCISFRRDPRR
jgi:hypothetical protein